MAHFVSKFLLVFSMTLLLSLPKMVFAGNSGVVVEQPTALAMTGDLIIARPALLLMTVLGTGVFLVSLPFTLLGGNFEEAGKTLVVGPAEATFVRCLGCTQPGYKSTPSSTEDEEE